MEKLAEKYYAMHLLACALQGVKPEGKPEEVSWEEVLQFCSRNGVAGTAYLSLEFMKREGMELPEKKLLEKWEEFYRLAVFRALKFEEAGEEIFRVFEQEKIRYLPLKGIILKDYYPVIGMRTFADYDILYDSQKMEAVRTLMEERGYRTESCGKGNHDIYQKLPMLNFEMHRSLSSESSPFRAYTDQAWERAVKDEGNDFGYHMTREDFYIYFIIHAYKHYTSAGTGVRMLLDQYLYLKKEKELDWEYLNGEFLEIGLTQFEQELRSLGERLLSGQGPVTLTEEQEEMLDSLISQGTYGTFSNLVRNGLILEGAKKVGMEKAKHRYLCRRIFPGKEYLQSNYPILKKHPSLYPMVVCGRLFRVIPGWKRIKKEIKYLIDIKK